MVTSPYPFHHRVELQVAMDAERLFSKLDDPGHVAAHMQKPSMMMAGGTMHVALDAMRGQGIGSVIRLRGRMLGIELAVDEVVTERIPPLLKTWETIGEPRLLVIGAYRMGFSIHPKGNYSGLAVFIDYCLPPRGIAYWIGRLFGGFYARWCTRRVAKEARTGVIAAS